MITAILAVALVAVLARAVPNLWVVLGAVAGIAVAVAVVLGYGPQLLAAAVIVVTVAGGGTVGIMVLLNKLVLP